MRLHQTYELYLTSADGSARFEPMTCAPDQRIHDLAEALLDSRGLASIEVRQGGEHQFTLERKT